MDTDIIYLNVYKIGSDPKLSTSVSMPFIAHQITGIIQIPSTSSDARYTPGTSIFTYNGKKYAVDQNQNQIKSLINQAQDEELFNSVFLFDRTKTFTSYSPAGNVSITLAGTGNKDKQTIEGKVTFSGGTSLTLSTDFEILSDDIENGQTMDAGDYWVKSTYYASLGVAQFSIKSMS